MQKRDHAKLICDVSELTGLFHDAPGMENFLQKITAMIASHMACEVCSIYLFYADTNELVLKATTGLNPSSIGQVKMNIGEGLTGQALLEKRPICEGQAKHNPNFRYFPGIGEEKFESFLAVPILRGHVEIGVMVIQSQQKNYFNQDDVQVFRAITSQLAATIETARLLMTLNEQKQHKQKKLVLADLKMVKGRSGSEGVAFAPAMVLEHAGMDMGKFVQSGKALSRDDFSKAILSSEKQLQDLQNSVEEALFDVAGLIFTAQILMLKDKGFTDAILALIEQGQDPAKAVAAVVDDYVRKFAAIPDGYLRDKMYDVKDVGRRILENMTGVRLPESEVAGHIVIAYELYPSDALKLYSQKVKGIVLLSGGSTSHVAILARSLNIPLIVVQEQALMEVPAGTKVLLDGVMGHMYVDPDEGEAQKVLDREDLNKNIGHLKSFIRDHPLTKDGTRVKLMANINLLGDLKAANEFKADGVGLYRTEFPFLVRNNFPSEEEQYLIYRRLAEGMPKKQVTIRTLDVGGDKLISYFDFAHEDNPFLGLRSIRFSLRNKDIFIQQIRAVLRAAHGHDVRLMFPMISSVDEFQEAKGIVQECVQDLQVQGLPFKDHMPIGIMVELPSVIEIIDDLAQEADFFSIGTNDLIQYILAVDRTNDQVAPLYMPHHPSVLRSIKKVIDAGLRHKKDVSMCGDMAHDVKMLPVLLGMGLRHFSVDARYLPHLHEAVSKINVQSAVLLSQKVLAESKAIRTLQVIDEYRV